MVFTHFKIEPSQQRRVLNWEVIGVVVLRGIMIFAGIGLVNEFEWLMYVFGVLVIYTGVIMSFGKEEEFDPSKNKIIKIARKIFTVTDTYSRRCVYTPAGWQVCRHATIHCSAGRRVN